MFRSLQRSFARRLPGAAVAAAWFSGAVTAAITAFLVVSVWPLLKSGKLLETFTGPWRPFAADPSYGVGPMAVVSLVMATLSVVLAFPVAVGLNAFIHGIGPHPWRRVVLAAVQFMTSIPTVVYGFVAVMALVPLVRRLLDQGSGFSLLAATVVLALLILPTMVLVLHARLAQADRDVYLACLALGMTPAQALLRVVLPAARGSLTAALILGFNRALGDTLIALMVAGNAPQVPDTLLDSVRTLTAHIALVLATDSFSPEYRSVAAAALLLFLLTASASLLIRRLASAGPR